jgi:pimeloyl-ACP methyl ester carboxylesterase
MQGHRNRSAVSGQVIRRDVHDRDQVPQGRRRRAEGVLPRGRPGRCADAAVTSRISERRSYVPRPHPAAREPVPCHRARSSRVRSVGHAESRKVDNIAGVIDRFTEVAGLHRFAVYLFDYGAPTGFRLAVRHPERITAIISQNGNAYEEGLSEGWNPIRAYWENASPANRQALRSFLAPETTVWQYTHGVPDPTAVSPDGYSLDNYYLSRPGAHELQLDLFGDYKSNVALYPTFQKYFRTHKPPFLAVWGKNDPFFLPAGAEAFKRDIPDAVVRFFDTGHFALETHAEEIAAAIRKFLA